LPGTRVSYARDCDAGCHKCPPPTRERRVVEFQDVKAGRGRGWLRRRRAFFEMPGLSDSWKGEQMISCGTSNSLISDTSRRLPRMKGKEVVIRFFERRQARRFSDARRPLA